MPAADAPTSPRGTVSTSAGFLSAWGGAIDELEHVADLQWPLSVRTYARMRHDPTLSSVLSAYCLPIRSTRWEIDPRGASPDMVRVCADSLGLPAKGRDKPGPVRTRGVVWLNHLETALSALTFGHACFEPVYRVDTGAALLASLADRPQLSLAEIEVDRQGALVGVTQYGDVTDPNPKPIPAGRLLWYVVNREGANWAGRSLLRSAFGPWLLKQDALRTHATGLRRFAAGIPVVEWAPGTSPTLEQQRAADAVAASVRVSDTGGAQMPPGARLRIQGVEGSFPDGLPFLRYLDEQMARSTLTSLLDLGSTPNGSRALGDNFAELLSLAQQATANLIAETATQLCARLVGFNAGADAPVPAVTVADLTTDELTLAESITKLIQAGAVEPDDDLEEWVRRVHRAPAKGAPRKQPAPPEALPPRLEGEPAPAQQQAARRRPARRAIAAAGDVPAAPARRELTDAEEAAGLDPEAVDTAREEILAELLAAWAAVEAAQHAELIAQITAAVGAAALAALTVDTSDAALALAAAMAAAARAGRDLAVAEAARQGVEVALPEIDEDALLERADALARVMGAQTSSAAAREALRLSGGGATGAEIADGVRAYFADLSVSWVEAQLGAAVQDGLTTGRALVLASGTRWFASEVLDKATCSRCRDIDGTEFASWDEAAAAYPTGGFRDCQGRLRCRGIVFATWAGEELGR